MRGLVTSGLAWKRASARVSCTTCAAQEEEGEGPQSFQQLHKGWHGRVPSAHPVQTAVVNGRRLRVPVLELLLRAAACAAAAPTSIFACSEEMAQEPAEQK